VQAGQGIGNRELGDPHATDLPCSRDEAGSSGRPLEAS